MVSQLLQALLPVIFVISLGYYAGRKQLLNKDGVRSFSTYVVRFALPAALFLGVFGFTPQQFANAPYVLTLVLALTLPFLIGLAIGHVVFKRTFAETGLFACNCGFPDMAYFGLPVLNAMLGAQALLPVIVGNLVTSVVMVPSVVFMLHPGTAEADRKRTDSFIWRALSTVKQPVVWVPILGLIFMFVGVTLPPIAKAPLKLVGDTAGGVGLFTLGIMLSHLAPRVNLATTITVVLFKNLLMPALALGLAQLFHLDGSLAKGAIIAAASPSASLGAMLSAEFQVGQTTIPAEVLASNLFGIASMGFWIVVVGQVL